MDELKCNSCSKVELCAWCKELSELKLKLKKN